MRPTRKSVSRTCRATYDQQLLLQKGEALDDLRGTDLVKRLDELRKQMHAESMEDLEKAAQAQGVSWEEFKQNLKNSIITQHVIGQEVGRHINVSQQEIQQFYDQHKSELDRPEQVRMSEILISTQKQPAVKTEKGQEALPSAVNSIRVGANSNVQDCVVLHGQRYLYPVMVGDWVTIGHNATVHGCVLEDMVLIGIGAVVLNGCRIGEGSIIAAGAVVPEETVVPPRDAMGRRPRQAAPRSGRQGPRVDP